jgi:hypothetical protein
LSPLEVSVSRRTSGLVRTKFDGARAPQVEIGLGDLGLQLGRPVAVRQPIFGHRAEGLDHLGDLVRRLVLGLAVLARFQIGGERLAAGLHRPCEVQRKGFRIEFLGGLGLCRHVAHGWTL